MWFEILLYFQESHFEHLLNGSCYHSENSKDFDKAKEKFIDMMDKDENKYEPLTPGDAFDYGFWAAVNILTGFKHDYER